MMNPNAQVGEDGAKVLNGLTHEPVEPEEVIAAGTLVQTGLMFQTFGEGGTIYYQCLLHDGREVCLDGVNLRDLAIA